jgi:putative DNA primase/helicase
VWICEGEKDADRLHEEGLIATTNIGGAGKWRDEYAPEFRDKPVVILEDKDDAGRAHSSMVARSLHGVAASVMVLLLPGLPPKGDASDWFDAGGTVAELRRLAAEAGAWAPRPDPLATRPRIIVSRAKFHRNAEAGEAALFAADWPLYRRDTHLVYPISCEIEASGGRVTRTAILARATIPLMRQWLNQAADWVRPGAHKKMVEAAPPPEVAELILHRAGYWPFHSIAGVITTPTMRADGTLVAGEGYDRQTRLFVVDGLPGLSIPDEPTRDDAICALNLLEGLLSEFPLVGGTARAVALSGLVTPVVRGMMPVAPMHVASAPAPGSGKSYLWDVASCIAVGRPMAVVAAGRDEAETEKRLAGACLRGQPLVSLDNLNGPLEGDFLCQMIERPFLDIRALGGSALATIENRITSYATGNNIRGRGDAVRRLLFCRLDANMAHPEQREFQSRPDKSVLRDRGSYVAACLTIARAYVVAGMPGRLKPLPSFEGWSDYVRSALVWLGCEDPVRTIEGGRSDDDREAAVAALFAAWPRGAGDMTSYTAAELIEAAKECNAQRPLRPELLEALKVVARDRRGDLSPLTLGHWLRDHRDRMVDGWKLKRKGTETRPTWCVEKP